MKIADGGLRMADRVRRLDGSILFIRNPQSAIRSGPPIVIAGVGNRHRGFTLAELLIAIAISTLVILLMGQVDMTRIFMSDQIRQNTNVDTWLALGHMERMLQVADRINLLGPTDIQFRRPPTGAGANLDLAASYTWAEYTLVGTQLRFFDNTVPGCVLSDTFDGITALTILYDNVALAPPGGEPLGGPDNNALGIALNARYIANITIRNGAYTNLMTGLSSVSPPPAAC